MATSLPASQGDSVELRKVEQLTDQMSKLDTDSGSDLAARDSITTVIDKAESAQPGGDCQPASPDYVPEIGEVRELGAEAPAMVELSAEERALAESGARELTEEEKAIIEKYNAVMLSSTKALCEAWKCVGFEIEEEDEDTESEDWFPKTFCTDGKLLAPLEDYPVEQRVALETPLFDDVPKDVFLIMYCWGYDSGCYTGISHDLVVEKLYRRAKYEGLPGRGFNVQTYYHPGRGGLLVKTPDTELTPLKLLDIFKLEYKNGIFCSHHRFIEIVEVFDYDDFIVIQVVCGS